MTHHIKSFIVIALTMVFVGCTASSLESQSVPRMSVEELNKRLGDDRLVVLDMRTGSQWRRSPVKIRGAVREDPEKIDWADKYAKDLTLVLYCT